jgi:hypothetical protein
VFVPGEKVMEAKRPMPPTTSKTSSSAITARNARSRRS